MQFQEIFNEDGLYRGSDFVDGFGFEVKGGILYTVDYGVDRKNRPVFPVKSTEIRLGRGIVRQNYKRILNINQLFMNFDDI